jgi:hypothetical protein
MRCSDSGFIRTLQDACVAGVPGDLRMPHGECLAACLEGAQEHGASTPESSSSTSSGRPVDPDDYTRLTRALGAIQVALREGAE